MYEAIRIDSEPWWLYLSAGAFVLLLFLAIGRLLPVLVERFEGKFKAELNERLAQAFIFFDPRYLLSLQIAILGVAFVLAWFIADSLVIAFVLILILGFSPKFILARLRKQRRIGLRSQLPDATLIIASSLRSGQSLPKALQSVADEMPAPISQDFELMLREIRLGVPIEQAFVRAESRLLLEEFQLLSAAVRIALATGGNLAESLNSLSLTMRSKLAIEGKIDALTSQGRLQAWVVGILPFAVAAVLHQIDPVGLLPMWTTPKGWIACALIVVLQTAGVLMIRRIVRIDV